MAEDRSSTKKPSKSTDSPTSDGKADSPPVSIEKNGPGNFPGITVEQLDELLEERQSGDRRKSNQAVEFPDRRVSDRREEDKSSKK